MDLSSAELQYYSIFDYNEHDDGFALSLSVFLPRVVKDGGCDIMRKASF